MASYAALILGEQIVKDDVYDARFIEKVDALRRDRVLSAMRWTNYMLVSLRDMAPDLLGFIEQLAQDRALADEFTDNFNYPEAQWDCFSSPARIESWIQSRVQGRARAVAENRHIPGSLISAKLKLLSSSDSDGGRHAHQRQRFPPCAFALDWRRMRRCDGRRRRQTWRHATAVCSVSADPPTVLACVNHVDRYLQDD